MTDCLIIGFNDSQFDRYRDMVRSMGESSGAYRDLSLAYVDVDGKPYRSMDLINRFYFEGETPAPEELFHNCDFLWPTILCLGTFLTRHGYSFDYANVFQLEKDELREKLLHDDVLTVAITTTLYVSPHPILEIISFIRQHNSNVKIVVGGPYIANQISTADLDQFHQLLSYLNADFYVISQEGELTLVRLLEALKGAGRFDKIPNLAYRDGDGDGFVLNELANEGNLLAENMVDYSLFPRRSIGEFVSLRTAKSCPFSCSFCGFPQRAGKYTYLSVEMVEKELDALAEIGTVSTLTFLDDTFNVPKPRFKEILRMMIRKQYGFKWNSFYRSDHGTEEVIELMGEAGCEGVFLGIESGSDRMLQVMNKTARRKHYLKAIPLLRQAGISTHANFIVGFPSDTYESFEESVSLIEEAKPDFYRAQLWYCDPMTPIWHRRDEFGVKGSAFKWSHDTMDSQTACDLVDKMFLCVEGSTWLPQHGFEQWSTFYLQRKGLSPAWIRRIVRDFNALVKDKLLHPSRSEPSPELVARMRSSCLAGRRGDAVPEPIEIFSGAEYLASERYWHEMFRDHRPTDLLHSIRDGRSGTGGLERSPEIALSAALLAGHGPEAGTEELLLAAWATLLSRISGQEEVALVAARATAAAVPLRLRTSWGRSFADLVASLHAELAAARAHPHGFAVVTNPWRMAQGGCARPKLEAGFDFRQPAESESGLDALLREWPTLADGLDLRLEVSAGEETFFVRFAYAAGAFEAATVDRLGGYLTAILEEAAEDRGSTLGSIVLERDVIARPDAVEADAREQFDF